MFQRKGIGQSAIGIPIYDLVLLLCATTFQNIITHEHHHNMRSNLKDSFIIDAETCFYGFLARSASAGMVYNAGFILNFRSLNILYSRKNKRTHRSILEKSNVDS